MKETSYLIIGLLFMILFVLIQQRKDKEDKKEGEEVIKYWHPGHLMSYYYPFSVPRVFRRHHRFHGNRFRHH